MGFHGCVLPAVTPDDWSNAKYVLDGVKLNTTELCNNESRFTIILSHGWVWGWQYKATWPNLYNNYKVGLGGEKRFPALVPLKRHTSEKVLVYFSMAKTTQDTHFNTCFFFFKLSFVIIYCIIFYLFSVYHFVGVHWWDLKFRSYLFGFLGHTEACVLFNPNEIVICDILRSATRCRCTTSTTWPRTQQISIAALFHHRKCKGYTKWRGKSLCRYAILWNTVIAYNAIYFLLLFQIIIQETKGLL